MNRKVQKASESGCEFILPDYMGDIKKLLFSRATVIPNGKFIGDGSLEISGTVEYELLYADSENNLSAINTSSDFSESFALGAAECLDSNEESRVANLKVRVTGPRKLSMKAEIETALVLCEEDSFGVEGDVFGGESSVETSTRVINYSNSTFKKSGEREYAEIMEKLGELSCDDVEIQLASACVRIDEAKAFEGYVEIKGENIVSAIVKNRDMPPYRT